MSILNEKTFHTQNGYVSVRELIESLKHRYVNCDDGDCLLHIAISIAEIEDKEARDIALRLLDKLRHESRRLEEQRTEVAKIASALEYLDKVIDEGNEAT